MLTHLFIYEYTSFQGKNCDEPKTDNHGYD